MLKPGGSERVSHPSVELVVRGAGGGPAVEQLAHRGGGVVRVVVEQRVQVVALGFGGVAGQFGGELLASQVCGAAGGDPVAARAEAGEAQVPPAGFGGLGHASSL